jgi:hypothetical protein
VSFDTFRVSQIWNFTNSKAIKVPYRVRYGEDSIININYPGKFYFDSTGLSTTDASAIAMRLEIISANLSCNTTDYSNGYIEVASDYSDKPATENNIICFKDGILIDTSGKFIDKGYNIFAYTDDSTGVIFKTFYYNKGNSSNDNLYKLNKDIIKNNIIGDTSTSYMGKLKEKLNLDISEYTKLNNICVVPMSNMRIASITNDKFAVCYVDTNGKGIVFIVKLIND